METNHFFPFNCQSHNLNLRCRSQVWGQGPQEKHRALHRKVASNPTEVHEGTSASATVQVQVHWCRQTCQSLTTFPKLQKPQTFPPWQGVHSAWADKTCLRMQLPYSADFSAGQVMSCDESPISSMTGVTWGKSPSCGAKWPAACHLQASLKKMR